MNKAISLTGWILLWTITLVSAGWALIFKTVGLAIFFLMCGGVLGAGWNGLCSWTSSIRRRVEKYLNVSIDKAVFVEKKLGPGRTQDFRVALERWFNDSKAESAFRTGGKSSGGGTLGVLETVGFSVAPLAWETVETGAGQLINLTSNGIYFLTWNDIPFVARIGNVENPMVDFDFYPHGVPATETGPRLEVLARNLDEISMIIEAITSAASAHSPLRGQLIYVSASRLGENQVELVAEPRPQVERSRIILPDEVFNVVSRALSSRLRHKLLLHKKGHKAKAGILLHGPPGTGKTLLARYLIGAFENYTAIVVKQLDAASVRHAYRLAGYLQPAIVVIEDVDLIASARDNNLQVDGLQELMNEMDGLSSATAAITVMTTNRPDVLEPALASRPGRISQAIEFPLPSGDLRRKLLDMYCSDIDTTQVDLDQWVQRTNGASPAFIEELVKRSILFAADRDVDDVRLTNDDFDQAIHELVVSGGQLTANVLGFPALANPDSKHVE